MNPKILIVEDDTNMLNLLQDILEDESYDVITSEDGLIGLEKFYESKPNLILLDVMMPKLDGYSFLKEIRKTDNTPVIIITARSLESDEIHGFDLGADDYITKPFKISLLVARVKALINRTMNLTSNDGVKKYGEIEINKNSHEVKIHNSNINLTAKEYQLLTFFSENSGIALSRDSILDKVWGFDYYGDTRTVDTHVKRLRNKLMDCKDYIKTIRGTGYIFEVPHEIY